MMNFDAEVIWYMKKFSLEKVWRDFQIVKQMNIGYNYWKKNGVFFFYN